MRRIALLVFLAILLTSCYVPQTNMGTLPTFTPVPNPTGTPTPRVYATLVSFSYFPELKAYQSGCSTPAGCAQLLINHGWEYDEIKEDETYGNNVIPSPARSLKKMVGQCATIAYAIAAGVLDDGYAPGILILVGPESSHAIYIYQDSGGMWGYVQILVLAPIYRPHVLVVDNQDPNFASIRDLFKYYTTEGTHSGEFDKYYFLTEKDLPVDWLTTGKAVETSTQTEAGP